MSDTATAAPAATDTAAPASIAGSALFGTPAADTAAPVVDASTATAAVVVDITPEEQAAKDLADAEAAKNEPPAVKKPGKDASPEEWAAFYKAIGAPEAATDYEVALPEGDDAENAARIQSLFKEANILPEQAAKLLEIRNKMFAEQTAAAAAAEEARIVALDSKNKAEVAELTNEWGSAATANMELARRGVQQFIPGDQARHDAVIGALEQAIGTKGAIKFFHDIGKALGEHDAAGLGAQNGTRTATKSTAEVLYPSTAGR